MEKSLINAILIILFILLVWFKFNSFKTRRKLKEDMEKVTPEFFNQKRARMLQNDYKKWLRKFYTLMGAEMLMRKDKGLIIQPHLINALVLTEQEIENLSNRTGEQLLRGKRISEEFKSNENQ